MKYAKVCCFFMEGAGVSGTPSKTIFMTKKQHKNLTTQKYQIFKNKFLQDLKKRKKKNKERK